MRARLLFLVALAVGSVLVFGLTAVAAPLAKNNPAPDIRALDINQNEVELTRIIDEGRDLVILFFFTVDSGQSVAAKLGLLDRKYGKERLEIIALGFEEDEAELKEFAEKLRIKYYIIDTSRLENEPWLKDIRELPLTLFVDADETRNIERAIRGGGTAHARILKEVAENLLLKGKAETAIAVADTAIEEGEDAKAATEVKAFALTAENKLDEAEAAFGSIDSSTGLAKVALERGEYDKAAELAAKSKDDSLATAIQGEALIRSGNVDEAAAVLKAGTAGGEDWKQSELQNTKGRLSQMQGDTEGAVASYQAAVELNPNNVVALSNEASAYRESGSLEDAKAVLDKASVKRPDDQYVVMMMNQIARELEEANDIKRQELIRAQIKDLTERFAAMKEAGETAKGDDWSTRPVIMAFLPGRGSRPFFRRAGMDVVLQREIESRVQANDQVSVVERTMLDQLLQELNLGSSELTSPDTQRRLGRVLSAGTLAFYEFAQLGAQSMMYLRLVDVETTSIVAQISAVVEENNPLVTVDAVVTQLMENVGNGRELKGLIADAADESAVIINLGTRHGVAVGQEFDVLQEGDPIEVGGRVIARRQRTVGKLVVTEADTDYAICRLTNLREGITLAKEMKIRQPKAK